jgi:hypothetical protein
VNANSISGAGCLAGKVALSTELIGFGYAARARPCSHDDAHCRAQPDERRHSQGPGSES